MQTIGLKLREHHAAVAIKVKNIQVHKFIY